MARTEEPAASPGTIRCPSCGHANRADRRFCAKCGARLGEVCAACGTQNEPDENFCSQCGAALSAATALSAAAKPVVRQEPPEAEKLPAGERRQLTVVFCDLVGSTALSQQLDPEEWRAVVVQYLKAAAEAVARLGGHVAKTLGDGLLVYFGWPRAHEDDAERAVRAGLGIVDAVGALNRRLKSRLAVRIGMDTGLVVIGEDGEVYGDTPNVAARVQALAEPDTVLVTAAAHRLVSGLFLVEERGAHALKGVPAPVTLYRVVQPSGVRSRLAAAAVLGLTPFIGREDERRLLRTRFEQAREGEGQVVLLVGEPGIGKSRLALVLHEDLAGVPHSWLESGGQPYFADTPFYAVTELLKQLFAWTGEDTPEARLATLERALGAAGLATQQALPLVAPLLDLPVPKGYPPVLAAPEVARRRLLATLAAWVLGAARLQPLVILLEDLHWVDPSTLGLQQLLVEQGATAQLLLLYTARGDFQAPWPLRAHHTQLMLSRLPRRHVREMVARVAARTALPEAVVDAVVTRTDGVPLFVEELTRADVEAGGAAAGMDIPPTLADSLMARLDRLGPPAKEVAQVGAVLGREFSYALLHAVHPLPEAELEAALARLVDAELVYPRGSPPEATYLFKHALVQEVAYESLLKTRRRELHRAIAQVLVEKFPAVAEAQPELLAQHWTAAGDAEAAIAAWQRAGDRAKEWSAYAQAADHYTKSIEMLGALPEVAERAQRE